MGGYGVTTNLVGVHPSLPPGLVSSTSTSDLLDVDFTHSNGTAHVVVAHSDTSVACYALTTPLSRPPTRHALNHASRCVYLRCGAPCRAAAAVSVVANNDHRLASPAKWDTPCAPPASPISDPAACVLPPHRGAVHPATPSRSISRLGIYKGCLRSHDELLNPPLAADHAENARVRGCPRCRRRRAGHQQLAARLPRQALGRL